MEARMMLAYALWCLSEAVEELPPPLGIDSLRFTDYGSHSLAQNRGNVACGQRSL